MPVRTSHSRTTSDPKSRKRRSLNLPLEVGTWDSEEFTRGSDWHANASPLKNDRLMSPLECTPAKRSSFHILLEQENEIQQQLQELARSENARLSPDSSASGIRDLGISSIPSTPSDSGSHTNRGKKRPISGIFSPGDFQFPVRRTGTPDLEDRSFNGREYSKSTSITSLPNSPDQIRRTRNSIKRAKRMAQKSSSMYVIGPQDVEKLYTGVDSIILDQTRGGNQTLPTEENIIYGPSRPGNLQGEALSWRMAGDLFRLTTSSQDKTLLHAPRGTSSLFDYLKFLWSLYSDPENVKHAFTSIQFIPPKEVVAKLRPDSRSFYRVGQLAIKSLCAIASFLILGIQMLLLLIMIIAYGIGSALSRPVQKAADLLFSKRQKKRRNDKHKMEKIKRKLKE